MIELLSGCACGLIVVLAFCLGRLTATSHPLLPVEPQLPDRQKLAQYEAEQKAFTDVMNYSAEVAYENVTKM